MIKNLYYYGGDGYKINRLKENSFHTKVILLSQESDKSIPEKMA